MFVFVFATYFVPIVLFLIGFRRASLWVASLISMVLIFIFTTGIGTGFHFLAGGSQGLTNFRFDLTASNHIDRGNYSMLSMIILLPWAAIYDFFISSFLMLRDTRSVWVALWQGFGVYINLMLFGATASAVSNLTMAQYFRDKAEGKV